MPVTNDSLGVTNDFHSSLHVKFDDVAIDTQVTSQSYLCSNGVASQAQIALDTSLFMDIFFEWHTLGSNP